LMLATGASAETQHAIGTGVFGGMITATVLAVFFVPVFFVVVLGAVDKMSSYFNKRSHRIAVKAVEGEL
ncbi:MAG: efflux RND transporter permease subunit, partial [Janthinobacterium sp.]